MTTIHAAILTATTVEALRDQFDAEIGRINEVHRAALDEERARVRRLLNLACTAAGDFPASCPDEESAIVEAVRGGMMKQRASVLAVVGGALRHEAKALDAAGAAAMKRVLDVVEALKAVQP